jgi:hypothetical protein
MKARLILTSLAFAFLLATAIVSVTPVLAAPLFITGHGADSCAEFAQSRVIAPTVEESYWVWAQGFMSGVNTIFLTQKLDSYNLAATSEDDQKKALRDYCSAHPNDNFETAVVKMQFAFPKTPPAK